MFTTARGTKPKGTGRTFLCFRLEEPREDRREIGIGLRVRVDLLH